MNEDSKRAVLRKLLPEGEQYIVTILGRLHKPEKADCYLGVTEHTLVIAQIDPHRPDTLMRGRAIAFDKIKSATCKKNLFGWQKVAIVSDAENVRMVLKDNTMGTSLDKNLQLQGVKYLCQRLQEFQ